LNPTDNFFLEVITVIPNKFRPVSFLEGKICENEVSKLLREVVLNGFILKMVVEVVKSPDRINSLPTETSKRIIKHLKGSSDVEKLQTAWQQLQDSVDTFVNTP